ncbi:MAG: hypothetical protein U0Q21_01795 [Dermatophilaceae bacterium]
MQATVHRFDPDSWSGEVILDDGIVLPFGPDALVESGLRLVRVGQRLSLETTPTEGGRPGIGRLWIVGIGEDETIR